MRSFREVGINRIGLAGMVGMLAAGQALAATNVAYTLEMGGDNHASAYKAGSPVLFTPGSTADNQTFAVGQAVTWGVRLAVTGTHAGVVNTGTQYATNGVANFVFDLELHSGSVAGPLVTTAVYQSSINDGNNGDLLTKAAFAMSFNVGNSGPGRVVDPISGLPVGSRMGGPLCGDVDASVDRLRSATYPTYYTGAGADQYKLVGMGAGYNAWKACCGRSQTTPGLGIDTSVTMPSGGHGLGSSLVLCEGQIANLAIGTYVLKVTPAAGTNVLRGDVNLAADQNSFAVAADATTGDTITFSVANPAAIKASNPSPANSSTVNSNPVPLSWTAGAFAVSHTVYFGTTTTPPAVSTDQAGTSFDPGALTNNTYYWRIDSKNIDGLVTTGDLWSFTVEIIEPLVITQWRSIRTHAGAGDQAIVLNPSVSSGPGVTSEPRLGGVQKIQVDLNQYSELMDMPIAVGSDSQLYVPVSTMIDADTLEMVFSSPIPDHVCLTIDLTGKLASAGGEVSGDPDCVVRNLYGDANPTNGGTINLSDALVIKARAGTPVAQSPWADLDLNGTIDNADALAAKAQLGGTVCP